MAQILLQNFGGKVVFLGGFHGTPWALTGVSGHLSVKFYIVWIVLKDKQFTLLI